MSFRIVFEKCHNIWWAVETFHEFNRSAAHCVDANMRSGHRPLCLRNFDIIQILQIVEIPNYVHSAHIKTSNDKFWWSFVKFMRTELPIKKKLTNNHYFQVRSRHSGVRVSPDFPSMIIAVDSVCTPSVVESISVDSWCHTCSATKFVDLAWTASSSHSAMCYCPVSTYAAPWNCTGMSDLYFA